MTWELVKIGKKGRHRPAGWEDDPMVSINQTCISFNWIVLEWFKANGGTTHVCWVMNKEKNEIALKVPSSSAERKEEDKIYLTKNGLSGYISINVQKKLPELASIIGRSLPAKQEGELVVIQLGGQ
ncbi:hypothetical protein AYO44_06940 [Planctomycetaceae bacterium SCGC AG-212-F19]|nr:hypothetical protein AYO44_06940 [Planctomycetaceae bacterium SCGC AG-212-F19]